MRWRIPLLVLLAVTVLFVLLRFWWMAPQQAPTWNDVALKSASGNCGVTSYCQSNNNQSTLDTWFRTTIGGQASERASCTCDTMTALLNAIDTCCPAGGAAAAVADSSGTCTTDGGMPTTPRARCAAPFGTVEISTTAFLNTGGPTMIDTWNCVDANNNPNQNLEELRAEWIKCCT